jgi:mRNA degradation ribonuclease J1/J2
MALVAACARLTESRRDNVVGKISRRSEIQNRRERVTGDAICNVGDKIIRSRKQLERRDLFSIITTFIEEQVLIPEIKTRGIQRQTIETRRVSGKSETILKALGKVVRDMRHGL